jgi:hypothetical protein
MRIFLCQLISTKMYRKTAITTQKKIDDRKYTLRFGLPNCGISYSIGMIEVRVVHLTSVHREFQHFLRHIHFQTAKELYM